MLIEVMVPGSCGEIAQGWRNGQPYMITCPVGFYSRAVVTDRTSVKSGFGTKARAALKTAYTYLGETHFPYGVTLESQLPTGKGMAASSADVAAVIVAAGAAYGERLLPEEVGELAAGIEPTDGIFYPGIADMNYMTGDLNKSYEDVPKMIISMFDTGGKINTVEFHSSYDENHAMKESSPELLNAIDDLDNGVTPEKLAKIAVLSARENQSVLEKPHYEEILEYAQSLGALGVNVAHSGTMIGIMWRPDDSMKNVVEAAKKIGEKFPFLEYFETDRLISGGFTIRRY